MTDHHDSTSTSARERELELEVARLRAELDTLRGEDPAAATSRLLAMAAATADKAVEEARREADEIVEEISGEAEARRDEATRVAAEAEAMAEEMLAKADRAQEAVEAANTTAAEIKAAAEADAAAHAAAEREKIAAEAAAFAEIRSTLDDERAALASYHETLRAQVQQLAETMVSFMGTELPASSQLAIGDLVPAELEAVLEASDDETATDIEDVEAEDQATDAETATGTEAVEAAAADESEPADTAVVSSLANPFALDDPFASDTEDPFASDTDGAETETERTAEAEPQSPDAAAGSDDLDEVDPFEVPPVVVGRTSEDTPDPWVDMLDTAIAEDDRVVDVPDSAIDERPAGPFGTFGGVPVVEDASGSDESPWSDDPSWVGHRADDVEDRPASAGLFSRARAEDEVTGFDDLAGEADDDTADDDVDTATETVETVSEDTESADDTAESAPPRRMGLFGMLGSRLVEQTNPDDLADALEDDDTDDEAFRQFLDGDDAPDPSRDWLLRPEQS